MDYQNKEHMKKVMDEYERLPDVDMMDKKLYDELRDVFNTSNNSNGEVMNTLKLMVIQMCEKFASDTDDNKSFTEEIQEEYK